MAEDAHVYTTAEVASMFSVSPKTVSRWADLGWITPVTTPGGHRRYPKPQIDELRTTPHRKTPTPQAVLDAVVHEHFNGDALTAILELATRHGITHQAISELTGKARPQAPRA